VWKVFGKKQKWIYEAVGKDETFLKAELEP
jgi:hypothetical protein